MSSVLGTFVVDENLAVDDVPLSVLSMILSLKMEYHRHGRIY